MRLKLFDWGPSPFCHKARAILEHKGLEYERVNVLGPAMVELWRRGRIGKVPALDIGGELVCDSTEIAYALDRLAPEPSLFPQGARERALCHAFEDWSDEALYWHGLYYLWVDPEGRELLPRAFKGPLGRAILPIYERRERAQLRGQGTGRKPPAMVRADLERNLDAVAGLLSPGPFLLGDRPYLCDFALSGQLVYLGRSPVGGRALEQRPRVGEYVARMRELRRAPAAKVAGEGATAARRHG